MSFQSHFEQLRHQQQQQSLPEPLQNAVNQSRSNPEILRDLIDSILKVIFLPPTTEEGDDDHDAFSLYLIDFLTNQLLFFVDSDNDTQEQKKPIFANSPYIKLFGDINKNKNSKQSRQDFFLEVVEGYFSQVQKNRTANVLISLSAFIARLIRAELCGCGFPPNNSNNNQDDGNEQRERDDDEEEERNSPLPHDLPQEEEASANAMELLELLENSENKRNERGPVVLAPHAVVLILCQIFTSSCTKSSSNNVPNFLLDLPSNAAERFEVKSICTIKNSSEISGTSKKSLFASRYVELLLSKLRSKSFVDASLKHIINNTRPESNTVNYNLTCEPDAAGKNEPSHFSSLTLEETALLSSFRALYLCFRSLYTNLLLAAAPSSPISQKSGAPIIKSILTWMHDDLLCNVGGIGSGIEGLCIKLQERNFEVFSSSSTSSSTANKNVKNENTETLLTDMLCLVFRVYNYFLAVFCDILDNEDDQEIASVSNGGRKNVFGSFITSQIIDSNLKILTLFRTVFPLEHLENLEKNNSEKSLTNIIQNPILLEIIHFWQILAEKSDDKNEGEDIEDDDDDEVLEDEEEERQGSSEFCFQILKNLLDNHNNDPTNFFSLLTQFTFYQSNDEDPADSVEKKEKEVGSSNKNSNDVKSVENAKKDSLELLATPASDCLATTANSVMELLAKSFGFEIFAPLALPIIYSNISQQQQQLEQNSKWRSLDAAIVLFGSLLCAPVKDASTTLVGPARSRVNEDAVAAKAAVGDTQKKSSKKPKKPKTTSVKKTSAAFSQLTTTANDENSNATVHGNHSLYQQVRMMIPHAISTLCDMALDENQAPGIRDSCIMVLQELLEETAMKNNWTGFLFTSHSFPDFLSVPVTSSKLRTNNKNNRFSSLENRDESRRGRRRERSGNAWARRGYSNSQECYRSLEVETQYELGQKFFETILILLEKSIEPQQQRPPVGQFRRVLNFLSQYGSWIDDEIISRNHDDSSDSGSELDESDDDNDNDDDDDLNEYDDDEEEEEDEDDDDHWLRSAAKNKARAKQHLVSGKKKNKFGGSAHRGDNNSENNKNPLLPSSSSSLLPAVKVVMPLKLLQRNIRNSKQYVRKAAGFLHAKYGPRVTLALLQCLEKSSACPPLNSVDRDGRPSDFYEFAELEEELDEVINCLASATVYGEEEVFEPGYAEGSSTSSDDEGDDDQEDDTHNSRLFLELPLPSMTPEQKNLARASLLNIIQLYEMKIKILLNIAGNNNVDHQAVSWSGRMKSYINVNNNKKRNNNNSQNESSSDNVVGNTNNYVETKKRDVEILTRTTRNISMLLGGMTNVFRRFADGGSLIGDLQSLDANEFSRHQIQQLLVLFLHVFRFCFDVLEYGDDENENIGEYQQRKSEEELRQLRDELNHDVEGLLQEAFMVIPALLEVACEDDTIKTDVAETLTQFSQFFFKILKRSVIGNSHNNNNNNNNNNYHNLHSSNHRIEVAEKIQTFTTLLGSVADISFALGDGTFEYFMSDMISTFTKLLIMLSSSPNMKDQKNNNNTNNDDDDDNQSSGHEKGNNGDDPDSDEEEYSETTLSELRREGYEQVKNYSRAQIMQYRTPLLETIGDVFLERAGIVRELPLGAMTQNFQAATRFLDDEDDLELTLLSNVRKTAGAVYSEFYDPINGKLRNETAKEYFDVLEKLRETEKGSKDGGRDDDDNEDNDSQFSEDSDSDDYDECGVEDSDKWLELRSLRHKKKYFNQMLDAFFNCTITGVIECCQGFAARDRARRSLHSNNNNKNDSAPKKSATEIELTKRKFEQEASLLLMATVKYISSLVKELIFRIEEWKQQLGGGAQNPLRQSRQTNNIKTVKKSKNGKTGSSNNNNSTEKLPFPKAVHMLLCDAIATLLDGIDRTRQVWLNNEAAKKLFEETFWNQKNSEGKSIFEIMLSSSFLHDEIVCNNKKENDDKKKNNRKPFIKMGKKGKEEKRLGESKAESRRQINAFTQALQSIERDVKSKTK